MKKSSLYYYFYIFLIASIVGWIIEGAFTFITQNVFINHSALVVGPFNVAYGICACGLTALLFKFKNKSCITIFLIGFIGGSILEYIMSFGMELVLGFTAWDYSHKFMNLNGRICLMYSIYWGILSVLWIKYAYPFIIKLIDKINQDFGKKAIVFLSVFLVIDTGLTVSAIARARAYEDGIDPRNPYEYFLDKTFNVEYLRNMFNNNWE